MKKQLLSFVLLMGLNSYAQQRLVLVESFSQASCGPCAAQNPALQAVLEANTNKAISIKYQVSWPGYDPMYLHNESEIDARVGYYGINGVPDRVQDGTNQDVTQSSIDTRFAVASPISMTASHTISSDFTTADVSVTLTAPAIWNPSNTVIQVALVEKEIIFATAPGSNGETEFHSVMRKMYPNETGTAVDASNFSAPGGTQTLNLTGIAIPSYIYDMTQMAFVVWVQNNTTKEVYQAAYSAPVALPNFADINSLSNVTPFSCATGLTNVGVELFNNGSTTVTSATVNYQVDNGAVQTLPYAGSIAPNGTANFVIPSIAASSGSHTLNVYLTNVNNTGSTAQLGLTSTSFATISSAGSAAPLTQDFAGSTFPYADYSLVSASGNNWVRHTSGAARYSFYTITAGNSGDMILEPVVLTGLNTPSISFDVAYKQYQAENDELTVYASSDCGATWTQLWQESGSTLANGLAASTSSFVATAANYHTETVSLAGFANQAKVFIKFTADSDYGNNLYVDNINISNSLSVEENSLSSAVLYPNPASNNVNVAFNAEGADYVINITDVTGRIVATTSLTKVEGAQNVSLNTSDLMSGNYFVTISGAAASFTQKLIIK